jgi:hypothetical protein
VFRLLAVSKRQGHAVPWVLLENVRGGTQQTAAAFERNSIQLVLVPLRGMARPPGVL